ncbi:hypothetical protein D3C73_1092160 [compost metagenome]
MSLTRKYSSTAFFNHSLTFQPPWPSGSATRNSPLSRPSITRLTSGRVEPSSSCRVSVARRSKALSMPNFSSSTPGPAGLRSDLRAMFSARAASAVLAGAFFTAAFFTAAFFGAAVFFATGSAAVVFLAAALLAVAAVFFAGLVAIRRGLRRFDQGPGRPALRHAAAAGRIQSGGGRVRH